MTHWNTQIDSDNVAWWYLDTKNMPVNTLGSETLFELETLINDARHNTALRGVIIASAKSSGFIAGANIQEFTQFSSAENAFDLIRKAQGIFDSLASLSVPTVALINGFCMGGGTELALACRFRVAEESPKTLIGLPEVKLGIHPGWGGTVRLPLLIGVVKSMKMILSGSPVTSVEAFKQGLVDIIVPERHLKTAAKKIILEQKSSQNPRKFPEKMLEKILGFAPVRPLAARLFRAQLSKRVPQIYYPAPFAVIDLWEKNGCISPLAMENEARSIANLITGETAQNLIRLFFLQNQLKNLAQKSAIKIQHVHVIGAGVMGGDIAAWCALQGLEVTLQDREAKFIAPALKRAHELFKFKLKQPRLIQQAFDRLMPDLTGEGISKADVIIEAIIENVKEKQDLFKLLEEKAKPNAILATNTSGIPLTVIGSDMKVPSRVIGLHFFNPVSRMLLVEIVHEKNTDQALFSKALIFIKQINKLPLPVKSAPGFLINRILMPYLLEAMILLFQENISPEMIDKAAIDFGMPVGPVELADTVGLDVCLSAAKYLLDSPEYQEIFDQLEKKVLAKKLGRKTGEGFYQYKNNQLEKNKHLLKSAQPEISQKISQRLILSMINESAACLREGIVDHQDLLDAGLVFGAGFAPFRGGPIHYAQKAGVETIKRQLESLSQQYGKRFLPDPGLSDFSGSTEQ